ncbi:bORF1 [Murid betaherpesvirus 8]|uniref:BORF1 n=1 Tax=Rat cytomegalovirus (isolate England) TaxID=1261657 RepID=A0A0E3SWM7_RCMVE|nr:bORF1 [Murid betaherpesvirus 8]WPH24933.1 bORF1 [Murid betaherpesvirus 8]WPH25067.1 bORF1 [Murid betaherpesvirus 8]
MSIYRSLDGAVSSCSVRGSPMSMIRGRHIYRYRGIDTAARSPPLGAVSVRVSVARGRRVTTTWAPDADGDRGANGALLRLLSPSSFFPLFSASRFSASSRGRRAAACRYHSHRRRALVGILPTGRP